MKKISAAFFLVLASFLSIPGTSSANFVTNKTAVRLNEDTFLYTVTYRLNFMNRDILTPLASKRGVAYGDDSPYVGYELIKDGKTITKKGEVYSVVLSEAEIVNNAYNVKDGKAEYFTLVAIVKLSPDLMSADNTGTNLSLQVTSLPFTLIKDGKVEGDFQESITDLIANYSTPSLLIK